MVKKIANMTIQELGALSKSLDNKTVKELKNIAREINSTLEYQKVPSFSTAKKDTLIYRIRWQLRLRQQILKYGQYKTLNDKFPKGDFEIWFAKKIRYRSHELDAKRDWTKWDYNVKEGLMKIPTKHSQLKKTHVFLGTMKKQHPEEVFAKLNSWSNNAQAYSLAKRFNTHENMKNGDFIYDRTTNELLIPYGIYGFKKFKISPK